MSETWEAYWEKLSTMSREERRENNPFAQAAADCILDHWAKLEAARVYDPVDKFFRASLSNESEK